MQVGDLIKLTVGVAVEPYMTLTLPNPGSCEAPIFLDPGEIMMPVQIMTYWTDPKNENDQLDACVCLIGGREGVFWCPLYILKTASTKINHT